ncbi:MAG: SocA family protein [Chloroflexi bacterium]|nr:SocA family protein [Chloroflexota bacterium]
MTEQEQIEKTRAVVRGMLSLTGRTLHRTELVKLIYLADNRFFESTGRTITGNTYMWHHYGPNSVSHAITCEAKELVDAGTIRMTVSESMYGGESFRYWVDDPDGEWGNIGSTLDAGERQVLMDIVSQYGNMSIQSLVGASKRTIPFEDARQYQLLEMKQDANAKNMRTKLESSGEFLEQAAVSLEEAENGEWVDDSEHGAR